MSSSPSPSSPNTPSTNIILSPGSTTISRPYSYNETSHNIPIDEHQPQLQQPVDSSPTPSRSYNIQVPQSGVKRSGSTESREKESTMAKRIRRSSPTVQDEVLSGRTSPSSDSHGADTDHDDGKGKHPELHRTETAPVKKKRTRTLTTPHQSAVLHALLAQSRFPTTAMREEVGRSIGLSARKVQIWFQNQRQKARRPRKEPDESSPLPPRYGPFPAYPPLSQFSQSVSLPGPSSPPTTSSPNPQLVPTTYNTPVQQPYVTGGHAQYPLEAHNDHPTEPQGRLLGPGVPGADSYGSTHHGQSRMSMDIPQAPPQDFNSQTRYLSEPPYQAYSPTGGLPSTSKHTALAVPAYDQTFNRTLPPLSFDPSGSQTAGPSVSGASNLPPHTPFIRLPLPELSRSRMMSSTSPQVPPHFVPQSPDPHGHSHATLPPPYTLQPEPQWDESTFSATLRPAALVTARTESLSARESCSSSATIWRETSAVRSRQDTPHSLELPAISGPSAPSEQEPTSSTRSIGGRYDPVRATFVPFSRTDSSPSPSQISHRDQDEELDSAQATSRNES